MRLSITSFAFAMLLCFSAFAQPDLTPTLVYPGDYFPVGSYKFDLLLKNIGTSLVPMGGYKIGWQVDNGPINEVLPTAPTYSIAPNYPQARVQGNFMASFPTPGTYKLKVWARMLNLQDANPANDTFVKTVKVLPYVPVKNVLMEVFKHQACCPCIYAACYEDSIVSLKPNYAIANIYTPATDVISNADGRAVDAVWMFGHPAILFDRFTFPHSYKIERPVTSFNGGDLVDDMHERDRYYVPLQVSFHSSTYNNTTGELKVKLKAKAYDAMSGDMRFNLYLTEDSVMAWQGCATPNPNNYYHRHVLRHMCGGPWGQAGSIPSVLTAGQDVFYEFTYNVPASYDKNKLELIGLVQLYNADSSKRVIVNSDKISFNNSLTLSSGSITKTEDGIQIYPNPATEQLTIANNTRYELQVILTDIGGRQVLTMPATKGKSILKIGKLPQGNYQIRVNDGNRTLKSQTIMKQ